MTQSGFVHCGKTWPADSKFCGMCRAPLGTGTGSGASAHAPVAPVVAMPVASDGTRWGRSRGVFAQRIEAADVKAFFTKHLDVDEGTRGLFLQHGRVVGELEPGRHTLQTVGDRLKSVVFGAAVAAVVCDVSSQRLEVTCTGLRTSDHVETNVTASLTVALNNPLNFYRNVMKGAPVVTADEVRALFQPTVLTVFGRVLHSTPVADLDHPNEVSERLYDELQAALSGQFSDLGLTFVRLDHAQFSCPSRDSLVRATASLDLDEAKLRLRERQRRLQQQLDNESHEDELARIQTQQEMTEFLARLTSQAEETRHRRAHDAKLAELGRERDMALATDKLLATKHDLEARRAFVKVWVDRQYQKQLGDLDHEIAREKLERKFELDSITLTEQLRLDQQRYDAQVERADAEFQRDLDQRIATTKAKVEESRIVAESNASNRVLDAETTANITRIAAEAEAHKLKTIREQQFSTLEALQSIEQKQKEQDLSLEGRRKQQELAAKHAELELELARLKATTELTQQQKAAAHAQEIERLRTMNELRTETLVAVSNPETAKLLAAQMQLGALKDFTPEQLAMVKAADSPALAQVLIAKYQAEAASTAAIQAATASAQAASNEQSKELYERMLQIQAAANANAQAAAQQNMAHFVQLTGMALHTQRDTAVAAATEYVPVPMPTEAPVPPGSRDSIGFKTPMPNPAAAHCPKCNHASAATAAFCARCGAVITASS